jgi:hypothetical protein
MSLEIRLRESEGATTITLSPFFNLAGKIVSIICIFYSYFMSGFSK